MGSGRDAAPAGDASTVNCLDQVRIWISSNGLPDKLRARLARLRAMNGDSRILLIVSRKVLTPTAAARLDGFARQVDIDVCDVAAIDAADADERVILEHIHAEIDGYFFRPAARGNLSVVSDYARLLRFVIDRGLCTDMDVEFTGPFSPTAAAVPSPAGVVARFKENGCLSNDVTAGRAASPIFRIARRNVALLVRTYREAACLFLSAAYGAELDPDSVSDHPLFFELRNRQHDRLLAGTARFSLAGGPDNLAISAHQAGLFCGWERGIERGAERGELTPLHVPHQLVPADLPDHLRYQPFDFGVTPPAAVRAEQRSELWPDSLPRVLSHWDHSWIADHHWHHLTVREVLLVKMLENGSWSPAAARSVEAGRSPAPCLVGPPRGAEAAGPSSDGSHLRRLTCGPTPDLPDTRANPSRVPVPRQADSPETARFLDQGIVAVGGLVDERTLDDLRECFDAEIAKKRAVTPLQQLSFNLAVDDCEHSTLKRIHELAHQPELTDILSRYFDGPFRFVSARGYRQGPCRPLRYRAWDYHQDMKTNGPGEELKVMLLLTDVAPEGQAMRYICGSQRLRWIFKTQRDTKFSIDEALRFASGGLFLAHGPAGTCVVFDTNGIHSGNRNLSATRDVLTLNFARESSAFYMFSHSTLTGAAVPGGPRERPGAPSTWRSDVVDAEHLATIRAEYRAAPDLAATRSRWTGSTVDLVDVMAADINMDLDLRLSSHFELDRARDIALVTIRDAGRDEEQYTEVVSRLDRAATGSPCLYRRADALTGAREMAGVARSRLVSRVECEASSHCAALIDDLCEALVRCDGVQRLRTTTAYLYFACAWADRLLAASGDAGRADTCQQLLDLYAHIVMEDDTVPRREDGRTR